MDLLEILMWISVAVLVIMLIVCFAICVHEAKREEKRIEMTDPCPKCGDKRRRTLHIDISRGYQCSMCGICGHMFQDTSDAAVRVGYCSDDDCDMYILEKPEVDEYGERLDEVR